MFTVKWVVREKEAEPVATEGFGVRSPDTVIGACRDRLASMRITHPDNPPDGFVVFDRNGKEVRRWFDLSLP
jgi:hypothetical protein